MRSPHTRPFGCFFAFLGAAAVFGAGFAIALQLLFGGGEALIEVRSDGVALKDKQPLGFDLAAVFLAMGLGFVGFGMGQASHSARPRVLWYACSIAHFAMIPITVGSMIATASFGDLNIVLVVLWLLVVGIALWLATRHPSYRHAEAMTALGRQENRIPDQRDSVL